MTADDKPRRTRPRWRLLAAPLMSLVLSVGLIFALCRSESLPPARAWSVADADRILWDPSLHWCDGSHGHVAGRGPVDKCLGSEAQVVGNLQQHLREPGFEDLMIRIIREHPNEALYSRVAECLAREGVKRAVPAIRARLSDSVDPITIECLAWALETLRAKESVPDLLRDFEHAGPYRVHAVATLGAGNQVAIAALKELRLTGTSPAAMQMLESVKTGDLSPLPSPHSK